MYSEDPYPFHREQRVSDLLSDSIAPPLMYTFHPSRTEDLFGWYSLPFGRYLRVFTLVRNMAFWGQGFTFLFQNSDFLTFFIKQEHISQEDQQGKYAVQAMI